MTELEFVTDNVTDISPVRALVQLKKLSCGGSGNAPAKLADLSPLKGLSLTALHFWYTQVTDLSPLQGMPLTHVDMWNTPVSDLAPLKEMRLTILQCGSTRLSDLSALSKMPLTKLFCDFKPERDAKLLRSIKTLEQINGKPAAEFWKEVEAQPSSSSAADNIPPAGFKTLFNGRDLTGWQGVVPIRKRNEVSASELEQLQKAANQKILPHWTVRDGVLHYDGQGDSLQTARDYKDFELRVDWKIGPGGDSGIYLRGTPQVQIWDKPEGSGGLFNNEQNPKTPLTVADKPVGEWNRFRIIMQDERVTVYLNDVLVVDKATMENSWDRSQPIYSAGPIELQHHTSTLEFKNIFLKQFK